MGATRGFWIPRARWAITCVNEALTPDSGQYPRFTRSTGTRAGFPQPADCGSQGDRPYEIEPDKGGIAGYALALLSQCDRGAQVS